MVVYYAYRTANDDNVVSEFHNIENLGYGLWRNNDIIGIGIAEPMSVFIEEEEYYKCKNIRITNVLSISQFIDANKTILIADNTLSFLAYACQENKLNIVQSLVSSGLLTKEVYRLENYHSLEDACKYGNFEIIKLLINNDIVDYADFQMNEHIYPLEKLFAYNQLEIIRYLHELYNLHDHPSLYNFVLDIVDSDDRYDLFVFSHENLGLNTGHIKDRDCLLLRAAVNHKSLNIVQYMNQHFDINDNDFRIRENIILKTACEHNHIGIVVYLLQYIRLTIEDLRSGYNYALRKACQNGHFNLVKYLHKEIGLTKKDFMSLDNFCRNKALENNHMNIVEYIDSL